MTPGNIENDVLNIEELKEIMDGDLELIKECFADFVQDFPGAFDEIKNAAIDKDSSKLDASAHKLKGTLRYLAAGTAADAAHALELSGKSNDMKGLEDKLQNLNNECRKLLDFIKNFNG